MIFSIIPLVLNRKESGTLIINNQVKRVRSSWPDLPAMDEKPTTEYFPRLVREYDRLEESRREL